MRRAGFALLAASTAVAACGRIITVPKQTSSGGLVPAGNVFIRFRVQGTLDFANLHYLVVFNVTGNGQTPYAAPNLQQYANYSFILVFGGTVAAGASYALLQLVNSGTSAGFTPIVIPTNPSYVTNFNQNSSGSGNEFTFTFNRLLLTPVQTTSPTPQPSPTPVGIPTLLSGVSSLWAINCFSADTNNNPIDGIANGGINDTTFSSFVIDTTKPFDNPVNKTVLTQVTNINAQMSLVEIINQP
jgi:hypothetical protein